MGRRWLVWSVLVWMAGVGAATAQLVCTDVGDFSTNVSASVDSEVVVFSGTTGKLGKRATGTGLAQLTSGVLAVVPLASQPFINVKLPPYNAVGDGVANDTAAIQAALDDAQDINVAGLTNGSGTVQLPPGIYRITSIAIPTQVVLQGSNMWTGGSTLRQDDGVDDDAVKLKCRDDDSYFYGGVRHLSIDKVHPVTDTIGSGISVTRTSGTCSLGESVILSDLHVSGFPVSGIQVPEGSAPLRITHVSTFANGQFGVDLRGQHQTVLLDSISGDNNGTALINVDGTGSTYDATMIHISNVKAESNPLVSTPGNPQEIVVLLNELQNARVTVESISATAGGDASEPPHELLRIKGELPIITRLVDAACSGCTNLLVDERNSFTLPWTHSVKEMFFREDGTYQIEGRHGYALQSLALGHNLAPPASGISAGILTQQGAANGITFQTLTRSTDSAPTGSFVKYKTAAAADVWNVDVTGTLVTGIIPQTRVVPQWLDQTDTASISIDCALYNYVRIDELSQTTTFNAPVTCTPNEGQTISIAIFSTTARTLSFATGTNAFSAAYGIALPTTSFTGQWVFYEFKWNGVLAKWVIVRATR